MPLELSCYTRLIYFRVLSRAHRGCVLLLTWPSIARAFAEYEKYQGALEKLVAQKTESQMVLEVCKCVSECVRACLSYGFTERVGASSIALGE